MAVAFTIVQFEFNRVPAAFVAYILATKPALTRRSLPSRAVHSNYIFAPGTDLSEHPRPTPHS